MIGTVDLPSIKLPACLKNLKTGNCLSIQFVMKQSPIWSIHLASLHTNTNSIWRCGNEEGVQKSSGKGMRSLVHPSQTRPTPYNQVQIC